MPHIVCIHDSARPIIRKKYIDDCIAKLEKSHAVAPLMQIYDSLIKLAEDSKNPEYVQDRHLYHKIQTPQFFDYQRIFQAHCEAREKNAKSYSDDISIAKDYGLKIEFCKGQYDNIKVTDKDTFDMAQTIISSKEPSPNGSKESFKHRTVTCLGYDCHAIKKTSAKNSAIIIGNISIPCGLEIIAHSDGDVVLHALCDALYGSVGSGDIGTYFPPSMEKWKNADSAIFLKHAINLLSKKNGQLVHADITIIAQKPIISPFSDKIKQRLAFLLGTLKHKIGVKAKTNENIGFIGRGEGIAALVVVSVLLPDFYSKCE